MMNGVGSTWNFLFHQKQQTTCLLPLVLKVDFLFYTKQPTTCLLPLVLKVDFDDNFKLAPTGFRHLKHK